MGQNARFDIFRNGNETADNSRRRQCGSSTSAAVCRLKTVTFARWKKGQFTRGCHRGRAGKIVGFVFADTSSAWKHEKNLHSGWRRGLFFFQKSVSCSCFRVKTFRRTDEEGKSEPRTVFLSEVCAMGSMGISPQKSIENFAIFEGVLP